MKKICLINLFILLLAFAGFAQAPLQEKNALVYGANIRYLEAGDASKPTIILLHGLGANAESWQLNIPALSANYHVIAPDQIGFGKSDKPLIAYRIETYVDFLEKFMAATKTEKATLVGNSMGGWIAVWFAARNPAKVEKLIIVDAAGYAPPKNFNLDLIDALNPSTREGTRTLIKAVFYNPVFSSDAVVDNFMTSRMTTGDGWTIQKLIESMKRGEGYIDDKVKAVKSPTLIIWGKQDGLVNVSDGERFNREIAGSKIIVFDRCGHVPQVEKAAEFNKAVLSFLAE